MYELTVPIDANPLPPSASSARGPTRSQFRTGVFKCEESLKNSMFFLIWHMCYRGSHIPDQRRNHQFIMQSVSIPYSQKPKKPIPSLLGQGELEGLRHRLGLATLDLLLAKLLLLESRGVGVEAQQDLLVLERVLLLHVATLRPGLALGRTQDALDFGGVDQTGEVGLGNDVGRQEEVLLQGRGLGGGAVDLVEGLEGGGRPDDEPAEVTTRGELQQVQGVDGGGLNTGDVAETLDELLAVDLGVVDDEGSAALAVAAATELALTGAELLGALDLLQVGAGTDGLQQTESGGGLGGGSTLEGGGVDNERNLGDGRDLVTTGEQEGGDGRSSQSRGGSESPGILLGSGSISG